MDWSQKRKILYAIGFVGILVALSAYPTYRILNKPATCFDQKQNGTEAGIDCGGGCALVCVAEVKQPHAVWAKAFQVSGSRYDLGAYVENPNTHAGIKNARYTMRVVDSAGKVLVEIKGETEIAPASRVLLFATGVDMPVSPNAVEVLFDSNDLTKWYRATTALSSVVSKNQSLKNVDTKPRFDAVLVNTDKVNDVTNLTLSAIIYDALRHPVAVSKTYVENIPKGGEQNIFFTWPDRFTKHPRGGMCTTPVDTMLVFDRSGSMDVGHKIPAEPLETAKNAAKAYIDMAEISDKVGLVSFANTPSSPIDHELSLDHNSVGNALSSIIIGKDGAQNTNLGDALKVAVAELQSERHNKTAKQVLIVLTDGEANRPLDPTKQIEGSYAEEYAGQVASDARTSGVLLYAIGLGLKINESFLRDRIEGDTPHYFNAPTAEGLQEIYKTLSSVICPPENFITEIMVTPRAIFAE
jgi:hypothetical protein